jgi:hypothetical protein
MDVCCSWLAEKGDAGKRRSVNIPLKPPLALRWKTKLKMPIEAIAHSGRVVVNCQGGIHALDLRTGNEVWQVQERGKKSYEFVQPAGNSQFVFFHARRDFRAVRWDNGQTVWSQEKKRSYPTDAVKPLVSGSHLLFDDELRDVSSGELIGHIKGLHPFMAGNRLIRLCEGAFECIGLPEGAVLWRQESKNYVHLISDSYLLASGGEPSCLFVHSMSDGNVIGQQVRNKPREDDSPTPAIPKARKAFGRLLPAALDEDLLIQWAVRDEWDGGSPPNDAPRDYRQWAEAYSLPDFRCLWRGEAVFHQQGGHADNGSPQLCVLTREYFWYVWRMNPAETQKSYLTALRRQDGRVAFQCAVGPWVEHMLAAEDTLIVIGRGGTVFCYGEK